MSVLKYQFSHICSAKKCIASDACIGTESSVCGVRGPRAQAYLKILGLPDGLHEVVLDNGGIEVLGLLSVGAVDCPEDLVRDVNAVKVTQELSSLGWIGKLA